MRLYNNIKSFVSKGDSRSVKAKKNIIGSMALKIVDILTDLALVPLALAYLTQTSYGIWLTIYSFTIWLNLFDVGVSHGLRNKLSSAISEKNSILIKKYTSTAYFIIGAISLLLLLIAIFIVPFVNWNFVLNTQAISNPVLKKILLIVLASFSLTLTLKIITSIFLAKQMPFLVSLINTTTKLGIAFGIVLIIYFSSESNLTYFATIYSVIPIVILMLFSIIMFRKKFKSFIPSIVYFDRSLIKDIMGLGLSFFIIQIGATMLFLTDNIIITQIFDPSAVTPYQITNKYFSITLIIFSIIIGPYWSAITEAYKKKEINWIKNSIYNLHKVWGILFILSIIMLLIFNPILKLWTGGEISVGFMLSSQFALFAILQSLNNIYTYFLNGVGILRVQLITGLVSLIINIPLSVFFAKTLNLGTAGIIMATNCSIVIYIITRRIQYLKIINGKAYRLWKK